MSRFKHVICAISGGVDSAVSAYLLKKEGFRVTGCFMRNWDRQEELLSNCNSKNDQTDAEYVCAKLGIPFISVDFSKNYWNQVFSQFLSEYEQGMTPNPDILCNKQIKFPMLFKYCEENVPDFDYIATGHYSRLKFDPILKKHRLLKSLDELKDQSFFLAQIDSSLFSRILFPVGDLTKKQVIQIAQQIGLNRITKKKSSRGICFIGKRKFSNFIEAYLPSNPGQILDLETGASLGEHDGLHLYTVGQKIVIKDKFNVNKKRYFTAKKDLTSNIIYAVPDTNHPGLYFEEFEIEKPYWICEEKEIRDIEIILDQNYDFKFQSIHMQTPIVYLRRTLDTESNEQKYFVKTKHHFRAIVAGQYAVFYSQDECIGSAKILNTPKSLYELAYSGKILNSDKLFCKNFSPHKIKNN